MFIYKGHITASVKALSLPVYWKPMAPNTPVVSVPLSPNDQEYKDVAKAFENSLASVKRTVIQV